MKYFLWDAVEPEDRQDTHELLEDLVDQHVEVIVRNVGLALDDVIEELAQEIRHDLRHDATFRQGIREMVRKRSKTLLAELLRADTPE
jgi:hypothetical protein